MANYVETGYKHEIPKPNLKEFDLEIGDRVVYRAKTDKRFETRFGLFDDPTYNVWKVIAISNHVFVCTNRFGIRTAFRKDEYRIGEVVRYDSKPVEKQSQTTAG